MPKPILERRSSVVPGTVEVGRVLSALRYDQPLTDSPLTQLDAVWDILLREGVADGTLGRAWALGVLVHDVVVEQLAAARRSAGVSPEEAGRGAAQLAADFAADSPELENWSALYYRYLDAGQVPAGEIAELVGLSRRTLGRRLAAARRRLAETLTARDRDAARRLAERTDVPIVDQIEVQPAAPVESFPEAAATLPVPTQLAEPLPAEPLPAETLLHAVRGAGGRRVQFTPDALDTLAAQRPRDLKAYRLSRVAAWSRPLYRVGARFVDLTLLLDRGEDASERWAAGQETFHDLGRLLESVDAPALVLLGSPGSGKSTLLRRLELDLAVAGLRDETECVPFMVSLGRYWSGGIGEEPLRPAEWLDQLWRHRYPDLRSFQQLLEDRLLVLLLDGLNEMQHSGLDDYRARILAWKRFLQATIAEYPGVRVVFACRSLDYGAPLSSPEQRVPQVRIEPLNDEQIRAFLHRYAPSDANSLWATVDGTPQLELVRNPYLLTLLIEQATASGEVPVGRAALFTSFVRRALRREIERDNPLFQPGPLLDERDYRRAMSGQRWANAWALPDRGALVPGLTDLAYGMQARFAGGRASQVSVEFDAALELIDRPAAEDIGRAGEALAVLDEHRGRDEVLFYHQLQLEYFAARRLAKDPEGAAARVRTEHRAAHVAPALEDVIAELETNEPLPPLPSTGWEEIVLLAASMSASPAVFVETLAGSNPPLAARAAAQSELAQRLPAPVLELQAERLIEMGADPSIDLRSRIEAGFALALLDDPRFELRSGTDAPFLQPPMVEVPAGDYVIGDDTEAALATGPKHVVRIAAFEIARFPVTNREWSLFMAAGGYDDDRWWETEDAKAWQRGELTALGSRRWVRDWLDKMRSDPTLLEAYIDQGMGPEQLVMWRDRLSMNEAVLQEHLERKYPQRKLTTPYSADRSQHVAATQPVSGVCWYEAMAYCSWLSAQSGQTYRLPSEVEWEAAARGGDDRQYPWGSTFESAACNSSESRIRRATPIGVIPLGRAPCGAEMLSGDVGEWTVSLWGSDAERCDYPYPYPDYIADPNTDHNTDPDRAGDGRELLDAPPTICRIQRGGSFLDSSDACMAFTRTGLPPDTRFHGFGLRLVRSPMEK